MGACYGDGLMGFIHEPEQDDAGKIAYLEGFAGLGLSHKFREIVGTRVLELAYKKGGKVETRWLSDEEAAPVLATGKKIGGSAPYSMFPECLNEQLYIPGCRTGGRGKVAWPDHSIDGWGFQPMRNAIAGMTEWIELAQRGEVRGDVEFLRELLQNLELASEHRLIFTIGY
jgi:hypothetical protein